MASVHNVIVRPLVTEASSASYQELGEYTFVVNPRATKGAIKAAVEQLFGVTVVGVWTSTRRGKERRVGSTTGKRPNWKKAIVKLKEGDSIEIFEGA